MYFCGMSYSLWYVDYVSIKTDFTSNRCTLSRERWDTSPYSELIITLGSNTCILFVIFQIMQPEAITYFGSNFKVFSNTWV